MLYVVVAVVGVVAGLLIGRRFPSAAAIAARLADDVKSKV